MFRQIAYYFGVYRKYIGCRLLIVFVLSALAAATEGLGIAMLLPLMVVADVDIGGAAMEPSGATAALQAVLERLGVGGSMVGIMLFIAGLFLLKGVIVFMAQAYQSHLQAQLLREIKASMFARYSVMDYGYYCRRNTGHFINIINTQIDGLVASFANYKTFFTMGITATVYLGTAFLFAWNFALMAVGAGLLLLVLFKGVNNRVHQLSRDAAAEQGTLNKFLVQTIQSFKYLAATAELGHLRTGVMGSIGKMARYLRNKEIAQALTDSLVEPIAVFFVLLVMIVQVTLLEASLAPIFVALVLFNRAMGSIMGIQKAWQQTLSKIGALETVEAEFGTLQRQQERQGGQTLGTFSGSLVFKEVSFVYGEGQADVLRDISLTIPANRKVAIVGESGAGKSTLIDMLTLMLRPCRGEIFIDGVAGHAVDLLSWRRQIGYVSQETVVFDDTVANNIALWKDDYNRDQQARRRIETAAAQAYADRFILDLPERYNTVVGDRGVRLSGGQRQRLFLARELYKNPRLLILDEATSALDSESERYIQQSIDALGGRTTVVVIAHRLSTIKNADYIYVLDRGRIIEAGTYRELLAAAGSRFSQMVELQALEP